MNTRKLPLFVFVSFLFASCAKNVQSCNRKTTGRRDYTIVVYSGGDTVFVDTLKNKILNEEAGNGMFYYKGDTLIEISGDYIIKSTK